jgi:hypothetical protein
MYVQLQNAFFFSKLWVETLKGRGHLDDLGVDWRLILNKKFWGELIAYFPWYDTGHIENEASNNSPIVACVFVTAVTFLPSRCLATIGRFLPSRCLATISGFLPIRCLATIRELVLSRYLATIRGIHRHTHRQQRDLISLLLFVSK